MTKILFLDEDVAWRASVKDVSSGRVHKSRKKKGSGEIEWNDSVLVHVPDVTHFVLEFGILYKDGLRSVAVGHAAFKSEEHDFALDPKKEHNLTIGPGDDNLLSVMISLKGEAKVKVANSPAAAPPPLPPIAGPVPVVYPPPSPPSLREPAPHVFVPPVPLGQMGEDGTEQQEEKGPQQQQQQQQQEEVEPREQQEQGQQQEQQEQQQRQQPHGQQQQQQGLEQQPQVQQQQQQGHELRQSTGAVVTTIDLSRVPGAMELRIIEGEFETTGTLFALIEEHKGEISVHSQLGHGTTFTLLIPEYSEGDENDNNPTR